MTGGWALADVERTVDEHGADREGNCAAGCQARGGGPAPFPCDVRLRFLQLANELRVDAVVRRVAEAMEPRPLSAVPPTEVTAADIIARARRRR